MADDTVLDEAIRTRVVRTQLDLVEAQALAVEERAPAQGAAPASAAVLAAVYAAPLVDPSEVERPTGVCRDPGKFVDFDRATRAAILAAAPPMFGPVVLVIVYGQCAVVGTFDSPDAAQAWWTVKWNRLAGKAPFAILPAPAGGERP